MWILVLYMVVFNPTGTTYKPQNFPTQVQFVPTVANKNNFSDRKDCAEAGRIWEAETKADYVKGGFSCVPMGK